MGLSIVVKSRGVGPNQTSGKLYMESIPVFRHEGSGGRPKNREPTLGHM